MITAIGPGNVVSSYFNANGTETWQPVQVTTQSAAMAAGPDGVRTLTRQARPFLSKLNPTALHRVKTASADDRAEAAHQRT